jgi:hypothetical protein
MNLWAIGAYCLLVAIYFVPVIIFIRRRRKVDRPPLKQHDQSPLDGLVATMPVDRW